MCMAIVIKGENTLAMALPIIDALMYMYTEDLKECTADGQIGRGTEVGNGDQ